MKVIHKRTNFVLGEDIRSATTFGERLQGLMFALISLWENNPQPFYTIHHTIFLYLGTVHSNTAKNRLVWPRSSSAPPPSMLPAID